MPIEIRSYRRVFDLERRIYRIDRLRLNPGGIPVRSLLYFAGSLLCALALRRLPLLGSIMGVLPWYAGDLAFPMIAATLLTAIHIEGRPVHLATLSLARFISGPRVLANGHPSVAFGTRWRPEEILLLPDGSDSRLRKLRYTGPGAALIVPAHERVHRPRGPIARLARRPDLTLVSLPGRRPPARARVIELAPGARLTVQ